jgi:hypothetical protein
MAVDFHPEEVVRDIQARYPQVLCSVHNNAVYLGSPERPEEVRIVGEHHDRVGRVTVQTKEWHGHWHTVSAAIDIALAVISGWALTMQEFRGSRLAATWLEPSGFELSGDLAHGTSLSLFLNPMDAGEWELWPGEQWNTVATSRWLVDIPDLFGSGSPLLPTGMSLGEVRKMEDVRDSSSPLHEPRMAEALERQFGPPRNGFRWTNSPKTHNLFFQLPHGWRSEQDTDPQERRAIFVPNVEGIALGVITYFRDKQPTGGASRLDQPLAPERITYDYYPSMENAEEWSCYRWDILFSDTDRDIRAIATIMRHQTCAMDGEQVRALMDPVWPDSRYHVALEPVPYGVP